jgi:hypothetical protein
LKVKKLRKYMGVQDDLAVVAAAKALESAGLLARSASEGLGERTGLYLAVGYIPFERADLDPLLAASLDAQGNFSMEAFSTAGFRTVNGLLTFRCLPNMPAYHVSTNFDIQGPYFVTYPGPGQFYVALEEALAALKEGSIDVALVGGVAHQRNFLVEWHLRRVHLSCLPYCPVDAAGCLVLEAASRAAARSTLVRAVLSGYDLRYYDFFPFSMARAYAQRFTTANESEVVTPGDMGAASLPAALSLAAAGGCAAVTHYLHSRDGIWVRSDWGLSL